MVANPLLFIIPDSLKTKYYQPDKVLINNSLFKSSKIKINSDNYLILWVFGEDYKANPILKLEATQGYQSAEIKLIDSPYEFEATIKDQRYVAYQVLENLIKLKQSQGQYELITCYDFHCPNGTEIYTKRQGIINLDEKPGIYYSSRHKTFFTNNGFKLVFAEVKI